MHSRTPDFCGSFGKKALGREQEVDRRAGRIHRPLKVTPLAFHPDVRLVHAPAVGPHWLPLALALSYPPATSPLPELISKKRC